MVQAPDTVLRELGRPFDATPVGSLLVQGTTLCPTHKSLYSFATITLSGVAPGITRDGYGIKASDVWVGCSAKYLIRIKLLLLVTIRPLNCNVATAFNAVANWQRVQITGNVP
jgi:hypothetical protein